MIHVDPDPVTIGGAANSTVDVTLICPMGWTLHDLPDWLTASPSSSSTGTGALGAPVTFTAQVNPNTSTRSATLTFTASNGDKVKLTVTQAVNSGFSLTLAHVTGQTDSYGTVEITIGAATGNIGGTSVTVKANSAAGCTFIKWVATNDRGATAVQDGATDAAAEYTFDITANTTLYAVFQGNGSDAAPIEVATVAQLNDVRNQLSWHYILMADLDLGVNPYNTGSGWNPIGTFTGVFDGNGHTISNLFIDRSTSDDVGLFSGLAGTVKNLHVGINSITGRDYTGGIVGRVYSTGKIEHCSVTGGSINGNVWVGGVAGANQGSISNCYVTGMVSGSNRVGGVAGANTGSISNCYATGAVSGTDRVGGVAGSNSGSISNCVALSATVKATAVGTDVGRVLGLLSPGGTLINNYAYDSMGTDGGTGFPGGSGLGHKNGEDCVAIPTAGWWTEDGRWNETGSNTAWDFSVGGVWKVTGGSWPKLQWEP